MGKEAKIGLAAVGILLLVFTALLIRRFVPLEAMTADSQASEQEEAAVQAAVQASAGAKPTIVAVQKDPSESAASDPPGSRPHRRHPNPRAAESSGEMPRRGFMPGQGEHRQSDEESGRETDNAPSAVSDPFQRTHSPRESTADVAEAPRELPRAPREASALEDRESTPESSGNPLRRLSAELPIDEVPAADEQAAIREAEEALDASERQLEIARERESLAAPPEIDPPAEPLERAAEPRRQRAPLDRWERPRSRYREPSEQPLERGAEQLEQAPQPPADGKYTIQPNDSLWSISEKVYGTGRYFKAIYQHNRARLPRADQLTVGTVIAVPAASLLEENYPELCPKQRKSVMVAPRGAQSRPRHAAPRGSDEYVVAEGDTLFDIARYELGKASRWSEIYDLNRDVFGEDFDYLQPGTQLRLPARDGRGDAISRPSGDRYQR